MRIRTSPTRRSSGAATVEMAIAVPLLIVLVFGTLEIGLLLKDYLGLNQATREAVRAASVGDSLEGIQTRVQSSAPTIDVSKFTWNGWFCELNPNGEWDTTWTPLADVGTQSDLRNNATAGAKVKIEATYEHQLVTGNVLAWLTDSSNPGVITLHSNMVMRRE